MELMTQQGSSTEAEAFYNFKRFLVQGDRRRHSSRDEMIARVSERTSSVHRESELSTRTSWRHDVSMYLTQVRIQGKHEAVYTKSLTDALHADALANAVARVGNSFEVQRKSKESRLAELSEKRSDDVSRTGCNSSMERGVIMEVRDDAHFGDLQFHILPDGCRADALYRSYDMPLGVWLMYQQKTTSKLLASVTKDRTIYKWVFKHVKGYEGMLVVCECNEDGNIWILDGNVLNRGRSNDLNITRSSATGNALAAPCDNACFPTTRDFLIDRMYLECQKVITNDPTALQTTTLEDAEDDLGKSLKIERRGIMAYIKCVLGGAVSCVGALNEELVERMTHSGAIFRYPEGQGTKTDLEVRFPSDDHWLRLQFKTPHTRPGCRGLHSTLLSRDGTDRNGTRINSNKYMPNDNDLYVFVKLLETDSLTEIHIWTITDSQMTGHNLLGEGARTGISLHMPDQIQESRGGAIDSRSMYGWTKAHHQMYMLE